MQQKSEEKFSHAQRLKNLRLTRQCNWSDLAADLNLSEGMIYAVISGKKYLSDKAEHRLANLEREAQVILGQEGAEKGHEPQALREAAPAYGVAAAPDPEQAQEYDSLMDELSRLRDRLDEAQRQLGVVDSAARRIRPRSSRSSKSTSSSRDIDAIVEAAEKVAGLRPQQPSKNK